MKCKDYEKQVNMLLNIVDIDENRVSDDDLPILVALQSLNAMSHEEQLHFSNLNNIKTHELGEKKVCYCVF